MVELSMMFQPALTPASQTSTRSILQHFFSMYSGIQHVTVEVPHPLEPDRYRQHSTVFFFFFLIDYLVKPSM